MTWYYQQAGEQRGPVTETDLDQLYNSGTVRGETLVWREGMASWTPYAEVKNIPNAAAVGAGTIPGKIICAECGKPFSPDEMIKFGDRFVCASCKPIFVQKLREGAVLPGSMDYAGFWIRVAAKILDSLILMVPIFIIAIVWGYSMARSRGQTEANASAMIIQAVLQIGFLGVSILYQTYFLGKYGATLGKMAVKLRVVTPEGQKISYGRAFGRGFADMLSGIICYIGYIMVAFDDEKRGLHDRICNTRVIKISR
ncbi:MAG: RDD family protein [Verrucomicrobiota bacterium]